MLYLLDTNILSEPIATTPDPNIIAMLKRHQNEITTATPVWHELWYGCLRLPKSKKQVLIERYFNQVVASLPLLGYDERAARWHAHERVRLAKIGKMPPFVDGQIAAIAYTNGLALITKNISDFTSFAGLSAINWANDYS
jgi:tRNA(fMet)-specific endonuclease VapC